MKKTSILFLSIFSVLLMASCTPAETPDESGPSKASQPSADMGTNLPTCLESCKMVTADTGLISKETCRVGCYMAEAQAKKDPTICISNVTDALMLPACLTSVAEALGDITICDKIGADKTDLMRGACYSTVAEKTKDVKSCEGIKDSMMYAGCVESVNEAAEE